MNTLSNNGRLIYSGKSRPCPICDRTKDADCRWNDNVFLCHTHIGTDAGIEGYIYRGATKCGTWDQIFPIQYQMLCVESLRVGDSLQECFMRMMKRLSLNFLDL
jgi:hypothetical protein